TDVEAGASDIVYTITALPTSAGALKLNDTALNVDDTFTQDDIDNNRITFVHNGTEPSATGSSLTVSYSVTDEVDGLGTNEARSLTIDVSPVNDAPELTVNAATVTQGEGETLGFTDSILSVADPDNTNAQLVFKIESLPTEGNLTINGAPVGIGSTFSYAHVVAGNVVVYTHDGGDVLSDSFTVSLRDGAGGVVGDDTPVAVDITINPVNTAPYLSGDHVWNSADGSTTKIYLSLDEGASGVAVFPNTAFNDAETADTANLTIQIVTLPTSSEAELYYGETKITQAMVDSDGGYTFSADTKDQLTIKHVSSEQENPPDVSFTIRVTDDDGSNPLSHDATVNVELQPVNDNPTGTSGSTPLDEGEYVNITTALLNADDVDTENSDLVFSLDDVPDYGYLFLDGSPVGAGATFTLGDITSGLLVYQHDGTSLASDSFSVTLRDGEGGSFEDGAETPLTVTFTINNTGDAGANGTYDTSGPVGDGGSINPGTGTGTDPDTELDNQVTTGTEQFVTNEDTAIEILEGELIANDSGDLPLNIISVQDGDNGTAVLDGDTVTFTPAENFNGFASFTYTVEDQDGDSATSTVTIMVLAQNDAPVLTTGTQTGFDEGAIVQVNSDALDTSDVDNPDSELIYTLTQLPDTTPDADEQDNPGTLYYDETPDTGIYNGDELDDDVRELRVNDTFTQADLDAGKIKFDHDGWEDHTATFNFTVTDGSENVLSGTATLQDTPVNDRPYINQDYTSTEVSGDDVIVDEGDEVIIDEVYIKTHDVDRNVEGNYTDTLTLSITDLPDYGTLWLDSNSDGTFDTEITEANKATTTFTQAQVNDNRLKYVHGNNEQTADSFVVQVQDDSGVSENDTNTATINIGIINLNDDPTQEVLGTATIYEGQQQTIHTSDLLDAADVDNTDDQIQFRITDNVDHGQLVKLDIIDNVLQETGVVLGANSVFTQAELNADRIVYRHDGTEVDSNANTVDDSFNYTISDSGGGNEPQGTLNIKIDGINDAPTIEVTDSFSGSEDQAIAITGITIDDPDAVDENGDVIADFASTDNMAATLTVTSGTLNVTATDSGTDSDIGVPTLNGNDTTSLTITGTLADINATLATLAYTGDQNFVGTDTINITVKDGGNTGTDPDLTGSGETLEGLTFNPALPSDGSSDTTFEQATASISVTVNAVNDVPVNTVPTLQSVDEDIPLVFSSDNNNTITIHDPDIADGGDYEAVVTLSVEHGTLTATASGSATVDNSGNSTITITGSKTDINATLDGLSYKGVAEYYGPDELTIVTRDQGNFGLGGEKSDTDTVAITVNPVNDIPESTAVTASGPEDNNLTFSLDGSDVDSGQDPIADDAQLTHYVINTLPDNGTLYASDNTQISEGDTITVAQATNMYFDPDEHFNGVVSFTFSAKDEAEAIDTTPATASLTINARNDAPVLSGGEDTIAFTEGTGYGDLGTSVILNTAQDIGITDQEITEDSAPQATDDFDDAYVTVSRDGGSVETDRFQVINNGSVSVSGTNISYTGIDSPVATITNDSSSGTLVVTFTEYANQNAVQAVLQSIAYNSVADNEEGDIQVNMVFNDGNTDNAQGDQGSKSSNTLSFTVNKTNLNQPPSFEGDGLITQAEGDTDAAGSTIADLMTDNFSDVDVPLSGSSLAGIAITADAADRVNEGWWEYSLDGTTWYDVTPADGSSDPDNDNALMLSADTQLRFVPVGDFNSTPDGNPGKLTVLAVDNSVTTTFTTSGTPVHVNVSALADPDDAESAIGWKDDTANYIEAEITQINDQPEILYLSATGEALEFSEAIGTNAAGAPVLLDSLAGDGGEDDPDENTDAQIVDVELTIRDEATFEGARLVIGAIDGDGNTDLDSSDLFEIAIANGVSLSGTPAGVEGVTLFADGATIKYNGTAVGTLTQNSVSDGQLVITFNEDASSEAVNAILRNIAYSNDNDVLVTGSKDIQVQFFDGNGIGEGSQGTGGELHATATIGVNLSATNDSPLLSSGVTLTTSEEDPITPTTVGDLLDTKFSDPDSATNNQLSGIAIAGFDDKELGEWQINLGTSGSPDWQSLSTISGNITGGISASDALLVARDTEIRFVPDSNDNTAGLTGSDLPSLSVHAVEAQAADGAVHTADGQGAEAIDTFTTDAGSPLVYNTTTDTSESRVSDDAVTIDVTVARENDAPVFIATLFSGTVVESAVADQGTDWEPLLTGITLTDVDPATTATLGNDVFGGGSLTISLTDRVVGDNFQLAGTFGEDQGVSSLNNAIDSTNDFVITFTTNATFDQVKAALAAIQYSNTQDNPPAGERAYTVTINDAKNIDADGDDAGDTAQDVTLTGGSITITDQNNPPEVTANGLSPDFTETETASDATAVSLFDSAVVDTIDTGDKITELVFTVSGLADGDAEKFTIDGVEINLTNNATGSGTNGSIGVTVSGTTATVTYTATSPIDETTAAGLINGLAYRNTSDDPTAGDRVVTIYSAQDDGGTDGSGADTTTNIGIKSTVTVIPSNDAPDLTATVDGTFTEGDAAPLQFLTGINVSDVDTTHFNNGSLTVALTAYYTDDTLSIVDGNNISVDGSNNVIYNSQTIGTVSGGNETNLVISFNSEYATPTATQALLGQIAFSSSSQNPTWAGDHETREVTVTLNDGGNSGTGTGSTSSDAGSTFTETFTVVGINDAPTLTNLDDTSATTYIQAGDAVVIDADAVLSDPDLEALNEGIATGNWNGSTLTIARNGVASAEDIFSATGSLSSISEASGNIVVSGTTIGTYTNSNGTLEFIFNSSATTELVNTALNSITYSNNVTTAGNLGYDHVDLDFTFDDQNSNNTTSGTVGLGQDQGSEGQKTVSGTITVNIDRLPVGVNDANSVDEGEAITDTTTTSGNVLTGVGNTEDAGADSDQDIFEGSTRTDSLVVTNAKDASDADYTAVTTNTTINGDYGTLTISSDGSYTYSVNNELSAVQALAVGESLPDTFTYQVHDGVRGYNTATVTITINGTNDLPTVSVDPGSYTPNEQLNAAEQDLSSTGTVIFNDVDASDVIDISTSYNNDIAWTKADDSSAGSLEPDLITALTTGSGTAPFSATATDAAAPGTTAWNYAANDLDLDFLSAGEKISFSYTVTAKDDSDATTTATVTVTINGTNDNPTVETTATTGVSEAIDASAQDLSDSGTLEFNDIDFNDVVDIAFVSKGNIAWSGGAIDSTLASDLVAGFSVVSVTDAAAPGDTNWSYSLDDADLDFLAKDETITFGYTITATDSQGGTGTTDVDFTITGTNDLPVISGGPATAGVTETDSGDLTTNGSFTIGDLDTTDVVNMTREVTSVTQKDSSDHVMGTDTSVPDNTALTNMLSITAQPVPDSTETGTANWVFDSGTETFDFLSTGETLAIKYTVTATDSEGTTDTETITITVTGTNDEPVITATDVTGAVIEDSTSGDPLMLRDSGSISFTDVDTTDTSDVTLSSVVTKTAADGVTLSDELSAVLDSALTINGAGVDSAANSGTVNWDFALDNDLTQYFADGEVVTAVYTISVNDGDYTTTQDMTITITGTNDAPVITAVDVSGS
ncbi:cadherin-like domain-containing protein, partial [Desulfoplanes sp.]